MLVHSLKMTGFISYSHNDIDYLNELRLALVSLRALRSEKFNSVNILLSAHMPLSSQEISQIIKGQTFNQILNERNIHICIDIKCKYLKYADYQLWKEQVTGKIFYLLDESHIQTWLNVLIASIQSTIEKLQTELNRLLRLAYGIHNKISLSPSPYKREPPIGGVKIGGKLYCFFRHVTEILYHNPIFC